MNKSQKFLKQYRVKRFKKGEILLVQGEVPDCAYAVKKGIVKSYNLTLQGEEKPIGFDMPGEIFPVGWVFGKLDHIQFYYEAYTDSEVYCLPAKEYLSFLQADPVAMKEAMDSIVSRYLSTQMRINALEQSKATHKVLNTIHFLCIRYGIEVRKHTVRILLPMTQQDLANFIGLTRETTGIELKKLHKQGVLTYKKQNYIIRTDKLDSLLDEEYGSGLKLEEHSGKRFTSGNAI